MQLDRIRIQPRLRNAWQSIDLGWMMARRWWWPLFLSWVIPYLLTLGIFLLILPSGYGWLASLLPWLCKPLWDAAPLYILSRRMFGERVSIQSAWLAAIKQMRWEILPWLSWRRLSPTRSMDMPVTVLEQLRGNLRRRRLGVLHLKSANGGGWLTIVCANLELAVGMGLLSLLYWFLPDSLTPSLRDFYDGEHSGLEALNYLVFACSAALVAPFYVAAGFSLYINRRIDLEGWDIEIRFRHMANAAQRRHTPLPVAAIFATALLALWLSPTLATRSYAAETITAPVVDRPAADITDDNLDDEQALDAQVVDPNDAARQSAHQSIKKILAGKDFNSEQPERHWRFKKDKDKPDKKATDKIPEWLIGAIEMLENIFGFTRDHQGGLLTIINLLRLLFWAALISLFAWLLYRYRDSLREWLHLPTPTRKHGGPATPEVMFGLDVRAQNLPDDVIAEVNRLWQQQLTREALSLLYRAALTQLLHKFALPFRDDMTEGECVRITADHIPDAVAGYFERLTRSWQQQAYAHVAPSAESMQEFCTQWQQVFGNAR